MWFDVHCATTRMYISSVTEVTVMQWCLHWRAYMLLQITDAKTSVSSGWSLRSAFTLLLTLLRPAPLIHIIMLDRLQRLVCLCWDPAGNVFAFYPNKQRFRCMTLRNHAHWCALLVPASFFLGLFHLNKLVASSYVFCFCFQTKGIKTT